MGQSSVAWVVYFTWQAQVLAVVVAGQAGGSSGPWVAVVVLTVAVMSTGWPSGPWVVCMSASGGVNGLASAVPRLLGSMHGWVLAVAVVGGLGLSSGPQKCMQARTAGVDLTGLSSHPWMLCEGGLFLRSLHSMYRLRWPCCWKGRIAVGGSSLGQSAARLQGCTLWPRLSLGQPS